MRILLTVLAYLGALVVVTAITAAVVLVLAGPHAGLLPEAIEVAILVLGWLTVLGLPFYIAWRVWRRLGTKMRNP
jgi:hypothetical protein